MCIGILELESYISSFSMFLSDMNVCSTFYILYTHSSLRTAVLECYPHISLCRAVRTLYHISAAWRHSVGPGCSPHATGAAESTQQTSYYPHVSMRDTSSRQHLLEVAHVCEGICEVGAAARGTFTGRFQPRVLQCLCSREALAWRGRQELLHQVLRPAEAD